MQLPLMRWPTTQGLGPRLMCLLITEQTWNRIMDHQLHHLLVTQVAPTDHLAHVGLETIRTLQVGQMGHKGQVDDDLGGKNYRILQHPSMLKLFSGRPHSVVVVRLQEGDSLCHLQVEACLQPHQEEVYSQ